MACTVCLLNKSLSTNIIRTASNQQCNIPKLVVFLFFIYIFFSMLSYNNTFRNNDALWSSDFHIYTLDWNADHIM